MNLSQIQVGGNVARALLKVSHGDRNEASRRAESILAEWFEDQKDAKAVARARKADAGLPSITLEEFKAHEGL